MNHFCETRNKRVQGLDIRTLETSSKTQCAVTCIATVGCYSVHYNEELRECALGSELQSYEASLQHTGTSHLSKLPCLS